MTYLIFTKFLSVHLKVKTKQYMFILLSQSFSDMMMENIRKAFA